MYGILGASGFLGQHLCDEFLNSNREIRKAGRSLGVDARSVQSVVNWIVGNDITHVINLAAECGGIGRNSREPGYLWLTATQIAAAVLEASRIAKISKLVNIGTVCSYAKNCPVPFSEDDLMHHGMPEPTNLGYGMAKLNGVIGAQMYRKQYGMDIISLIPVNLYGPGDHFDLNNSHVIPALIRKCHEAKVSNSPNITVWGTGIATREFLFVKDCAKAIRLATDNYSSPEPVNIGSGREISIRSLVGVIKDSIEYNGKIIWDSTKPDGQPRRALDVTKAQAFGFAASVDIEDGISQTIDWWMEHGD